MSNIRTIMIGHFRIIRFPWPLRSRRTWLEWRGSRSIRRSRRKLHCWCQSKIRRRIGQNSESSNLKIIKPGFEFFKRLYRFVRSYFKYEEYVSRVKLPIFIIHSSYKSFMISFQISRGTRTRAQGNWLPHPVRRKSRNRRKNRSRLIMTS